jgi:hypothetical protein
VKIGIGIPNQIRDVNARVLPDWAVRAEDAGFFTLGTVGRIAFPGVMDTVALAAAAGASRIGLFTNVLLGPVWGSCIKAKGVLATPRSVNERPLGTLETVTNQTPKGPAARI